MKDSRKTMDEKEQALYAMAQIFGLEGDPWTQGNIILVLSARGANKQRLLSKALYEFAVAELGGKDELPPAVFED